MISLRIIPIIVLATVYAFVSDVSYSQGFEVSDRARPRVNYWKDIFTRYGKHHAVIHHRDFPQVVFDVLDMYDEAARLSDVQIERYRKAQIRSRIDEIEKVLARLAANNPPANDFERQIQTAMAPLGRGTAKYRAVLDGNAIRAQRGIKERYREAVIRSGRYMHILEEIFVSEYNLPVELTRLPFIESSFDYTAYSHAGAAGIWQFMPATARGYRLRVDRLIDERRDVISATRAAAQYMRDGYQRFQLWPLAVTSYNHGMAGVARRVRDFGSRDLFEMIEHPTRQPFGFASQNFYPEFLAAVEIYKDPQRYFPGVQIEEPLRLAIRDLPFSTSVKHVSSQLGIDVDELKSLNYAVSAQIWRGQAAIPAGYVLKVPYRYRTRLAELRLDRAEGQKSFAASAVYGGATYRVRRGDNLGSIARKYGTSISDLRKMNGLRSDVIKIGQILTVRPQESRPTSGGSPSSQGGIHTVRSGDTLYGLARRYGTSVSQIQQANNLRSTTLRVGQRLQMPGGSASAEVSYRVRSGDSLWSIAKKYGISVTMLRQRNNLRSSKIRPGQSIIIPGR